MATAMAFGFAAALFAADPPKETDAEKDAEKTLVEAGRKAVRDGKRTLVQCLAIAMKEVEGASPVEVKAERHGSETVFGSYLLKGDELREVEVDVVSGKILKSKMKTVPAERMSQYKTLASRSKVAFVRAIKLAEEKCKDGKPIRVRLEDKGSAKDRVVQIGVYFLDGDKLVEVELNSERGEVLAVKERLFR